MPLAIYQLDNIFPPQWQDREPPPGEDHVDVQTSVRFLLGPDKMNYFVFQRIEGDLFKRDLMINDLARQIVDYLGTRTGVAYNLPVTRIQSGHYAEIGRITLTPTQTPSVFLIAADLEVVQGDPSKGILEIVDNPFTGPRDPFEDLTDPPVIFRTAIASNRPTENFFAAVLTTDRVLLPNDTPGVALNGHTYSFRVRNSNAISSHIQDIPVLDRPIEPPLTIDACACVIWQASTRTVTP